MLVCVAMVRVVIGSAAIGGVAIVRIAEVRLEQHVPLLLGDETGRRTRGAHELGAVAWLGLGLGSGPGPGSGLGLGLGLGL